MVSFVSSDRAPHAIVSDVRQSDASSTPHTRMGRVAFIEKDITNKTKLDASAKTFQAPGLVLHGTGMEHQFI